MVERRATVTHQPIEQPPLRVVEQVEPSPEIPFQPLIIPALKVLIARPAVENYGDLILERIRQAGSLSPSKNGHAEPRQANTIPVFVAKTPKFKPSDLLPGTLAALDRAKDVPLLPAPPTFEEAFARFEPMFHTVFYRRYPYHQLDDAKQNALLHLWKLWKKDMRVLEQSAAYVVQAAVWGASPHRKIQKDKRRDKHELPMLQYERYIDIRIADQSRDPGWVQRTDLQVDLHHAIATLTGELQAEPDAAACVAVLEDIVRGRSIQAGRKCSTFSTRVYKEKRDELMERLRVLLLDYAPADYMQ